MTTKTVLAALALSLAPTLALAYCGDRAMPTTAMSCAEGQTLDQATGRCVDEAVTS